MLKKGRKREKRKRKRERERERKREAEREHSRAALATVVPSASNASRFGIKIARIRRRCVLPGCLTVLVHLRVCFFRVIGQAEANGGTDGRRSVCCQAEHEAGKKSESRAARLSVIVRHLNDIEPRPASIPRFRFFAHAF